ARMEDDLDHIASGEADAEPWLSRFYFGDGSGNGNDEANGAGRGLKELTRDIDDIDASEINSIPLGADADGVPIVAKPGRYGPYLKRGDDTASIPDDLAPDE